MKIHYRKPTLLELMSHAVNTADAKKPIECFELTSEELSACYTNFDRAVDKGSVVSYSYKGIPIKVKQ